MEHSLSISIDPLVKDMEGKRLSKNVKYIRSKVENVGLKVRDTLIYRLKTRFEILMEGLCTISGILSQRLGFKMPDPKS